MYTQCPECGSAFRVTAEVLKVAAGKVRCGSCANAFNALEYLSEEMPEQKSAATEVEPQLPELKPEPAQQDDGLPESISAEQSAALLKTLDELAGSDIRIEDTGVEWRLLDDDDEDEVEVVDEVLEDSPTPVDEFLTSTPEVVDAPEIFEESANAPAQTPVEELRFDDNTPLPEDFGFEEEPALSTPAEEPEAEAEPEPEPAEPQPDITLSDPHEWTDILDEFEDLASEVARPLDAELDALLEEEEEDEISEESELEADEDIEDLLVEDDDDEDATRVDELVDEEPVDEDTSIEDLEFASEDDEPVAEDYEDEDIEDFVEDEDEDIDDFVEEVEEEDVDDEDDVEEEIEEEDLEDDEDLDVVDEDPQLDLIEEPEVEEHDIEAELAMIGDGEDEAIDEETESDEESDSGEHYVPPMTEEEQTVNMQIDQELFAIAVEDDDGFASTIVIPDDKTEEKALESKEDADESDDDEVQDDSQTEVGFETIIMEGAEIKGALDDEKRAADVAEAAELQAIAKAAEAEAANKSNSQRYGMIAGIVVLVLLLVVQFVHQSREALATNEVFNNTIGPIYRALGKPLQPSWDITGWQFEATRGSAEMEAEDNSTETNETLTVYSRIGNNSEAALPYPLIRISLIDRVMEPLGSHVLEPKDYLGENMDPRKLVEPGESFEAAISVKLESEGVPNFQLHVCYRHTDHQLRCKDQNFK